ncbi:MAG TPA: LCP family protein [Gaiellaceae bacterium]|jgi:LCP family protein required for cell wall assembly|nr:LCP family protein [Gaiellaceae bacterium]
MKTTLKRGVGRGAELNGQNGHAVFPPAAVSSVVKYRAPVAGRTGLGLIGRILLFVLLVILAVGIAGAGAAYLYFHDTVSGLQAHSLPVKIAEKQLHVTLPGHAAIALVLGYDQRAGAEFSSQSRSDTVMLIRADPSTKSISMLSIPRDLGVPIYCPGTSTPLRTDKINSAYATCGPKGTVDTVQHMTNLPINFLVTVNFRGFQQLVDKIGGIWLDIDRRYFHVNDGSASEDYSNINIQPGYQLLSGTNALAFVRYRHTDDDYHRIARQQQFVRAFKEQMTKSLGPSQILSFVKILKQNVEIGAPPGALSDSSVLGWGLFLLSLPGGHFFQDKIAGVTGDSQTSTAPQNIAAAVQEFTHPNVTVSKAANAAALGKKLKVKNAPPVPSKTSVLVLNGNGVGGSAANGSYLLRQKGYVTVLPPGNVDPNAPTQNYFHTAIYYDKRQKGALDAANALAKLFVPANVGPLPKSPKLRALDPGAMAVVVVGSTFHNQLVTQPPPPPAPVHVAPNVRSDGTTGLGLIAPYKDKVPFTLEVPTVLESSSYPDDQYGDKAKRLYWIDKKNHEKAIRLVFKTGADEYWGIEETNMPNPPVLADKSFQHNIKGREFQLYYSGSNLHMIVLRVHDKSYWVVNTLLDSLSNETMIAIAAGLKPLPDGKHAK